MLRRLLVLCALAGCKQPESHSAKPIGERGATKALSSIAGKNAPANPEEKMTYDDFAKGALEGLRLATASHQELWGLGSFDRWDFDQETGILRFTKPDLVVEAPAQILGSYSTESATWLWAWDNSSIQPSMAKDANTVRAYGVEHGYERLATAEWSASEEDAWEVAAVAMRITEASGIYRGPAGPAYVFISFGEVKIMKATP